MRTSSGRASGIGEGDARSRALRSTNNPEGEGSSIHVRSADPGVCMKNPEVDGSSIHTGRDCGGVFIVSEGVLCHERAGFEEENDSTY
jgi:hypothetical protein